MTDLAAWILSLLVLGAGALCRPHLARCPVGWYDYDGVRPSGEFTCAPTPVGPDWEPMQPDRGSQPTPRLVGRVYCDGRALADVDGRTVLCSERTSRR